MSTEALRAQVRELLQSSRLARAPAGSPGVLVPLRLGSAQDAAILADILRRVAASPALAQAAAAGLLRFDLCLDLPGGSGPGAQPAVACCDSCRDHKPCECPSASAPFSPLPKTTGSAITEIKGVLTERSVKALGPAVTQVRLAKGAVLTPLGRDALKRRSIQVLRGDQA